MPSCRSTWTTSPSCGSGWRAAPVAPTAPPPTLRSMAGLSTLSAMIGELRRDLAAASARDPAAKGVRPAEILAAWPGVHALLAHRVAHALRRAGVPFAPRALAYLSRSLTG